MAEPGTRRRGRRRSTNGGGGAVVSEAEDAKLINAMPVEVEAAVRGRLDDDESLLAAIDADMHPSGGFGQAWFIATDRRLLACVPAELPVNGVVEVPLRDARVLVRRQLPGCCRLQVHTPQRAITMAWYSHARLEAFDRALEVLRPHVAAAAEAAGHEGETWSTDQPHGHDEKPARPPKMCERCGKPIPRWMGACPACLDKRRILLRLLRRIRPYAIPVVAGLLLMLFLTAIEMCQPLLILVLVDHVIPHRDMVLFGWVIAGIVGIHAFGSLFTGIRSYLMAWFGQRVVYDLRAEMYEHVQALSLEFYDRKGTGWIMDRVCSDTDNIQDFLTEGLQDMLRDFMTVIVIVTIMFMMDPSLTLVTLLPAPLVVVLSMIFVKRAHRLWHLIWRRRSRITGLLADVIPGVRVVKAFSREAHEIDRFGDRSRAFMDTNVRAHRTFSTFHPTVSFVTSMGFVAIWAYGGYQAITGDLKVGMLIAFISYLWRFYGPLNNLTRLSMRLQRAATAAQRVFEVLDTEPSVKAPAHGTHMPRIEGRIQFEGVSFGYDPHKPVLKDLNFVVEPGQMVGLVGPSGAGKSTLINLLCRFYDVDEGSICIDGVDVRDVTLGSMHAQMGVVLQETFLFHGTVAENIVYGNPDAQMADVVRAARAANAHDFIMRFTDGYDTLVGERGARLSGGERQRIAIARAILKNPRILILDEATASVDTETEAAIREALERLIRGRTTIAIAHRFSTLRDADRLIVIEDGQIVEMGDHADLMAREGGIFKRLCEMQNDLSRIVAVGG